MRFAAGKLPLDEMPDRLWMPVDPDRHIRKTLPDFAEAGGCFVVSGRVVEQLQGFDSGPNLQSPVALVKDDRQTPFAGTLFLFPAVVRKEGFKLAHQKNMHMPVFQKGDIFQATVRSTFEAGNSGFNANRSVLSCADFRKDPRLDYSAFVSNRLFRALHSGKNLKRLHALCCPVGPDR